MERSSKALPVLRLCPFPVWNIIRGCRAKSGQTRICEGKEKVNKHGELYLVVGEYFVRLINY